MASLVAVPKNNGENNGESPNKKRVRKKTSIFIEIKVPEDEVSKSVEGIEHVLATYKGK